MIFTAVIILSRLPHTALRPQRQLAMLLHDVTSPISTLYFLRYIELRRVATANSAANRTFRAVYVHGLEECFVFQAGVRDQICKYLTASEARRHLEAIGKRSSGSGSSSTGEETGESYSTGSVRNDRILRPKTEARDIGRDGGRGEEPGQRANTG